MINLKNQDFINATKAILVVVLTFIAVYRFTTPVAMYFALYTACCVALMQVGETKSKQFLSMVLAGMAFLFFLSFGLLIKAHMVWANVGLIVFAFAAFYLPNLGWTYKLSPVLGLVFYEFVLSMPTHTSPFLTTVLASAIGVVIGIVVYFLFWPYETKHELTLLAETMLRQYRSLLEQQFSAPAKESLQTLSTLLAAYEKLNEASLLKKEEAEYFDSLYLRLYSLLQINLMIIERPPSLSPETRPVAQAIFRDLISRLKAIEYHFDQMVPHSLIAKNVIGRSLNLGKALTQPILRMVQKPRKARLSEEEFNHLLEDLVKNDLSLNRRFAFGLLRIYELLQNIREQQAQMHFEVSQAMFL